MMRRSATHCICGKSGARLGRAALLGLAVLALVACSEEQQNRLARLGVTWLEGSYRVTYADGEHVKSWIVRDSKVTSEADKGYYYFWTRVDGKDRYVQTPIARSYIEEIE